jgi:hypothetical protein
MAKTEKKKNSNNGFLYIKIEKTVPDIVEEYCKIAGVSVMDLGFHHGIISGKGGTESIQSMAAVSQIFFYAGVYYAMEHKNRIEYGYKTDKALQEIATTMKKLKDVTPPNYLG